MNLADELALCSVDANGHAFSPKVIPALGGALVTELVLAERVRIEGGAVAVADSKPTGDELADELLAGLDDAGTHSLDAPGWLTRVGMNVVPRVHDRLVAAGAVTVEPGGRSWLVVVRKPDRLRLTPTGEEPRGRVRALLLDQREPDPRTVALAGLVSAGGLVKLLVEGGARREAERRATALARGEALPEAVSEAIAASQRATAATTTAAQASIQ